MKYIMIVMLLFSLAGCKSTLDNMWIAAKMGEVERVEYLPEAFCSSARTVIYFKDGSIFNLYGTYNLPSRHIKIYKSTYNSTYRIEADEKL